MSPPTADLQASAPTATGRRIVRALELARLNKAGLARALARQLNIDVEAARRYVKRWTNGRTIPKPASLAAIAAALAAETGESPDVFRAVLQPDEDDEAAELRRRLRAMGDLLEEAHATFQWLNDVLLVEAARRKDEVA